MIWAASFGNTYQHLLRRTLHRFLTPLSKQTLINYFLFLITPAIMLKKNKNWENKKDTIKIGAKTFFSSSNLVGL
jgi:hypothetical protein